MINVGILLAIIVLAAYSIADTFGKRVVLRLGYKRATAVVSGLGMIPFILLYAFLPSQAITAYSIELSAIAGVFYGLGFLLLYKSLVTEQTTNTFALSEFFKAWLVLLGVFILGNVLVLGQEAGVVLIFAGSFLVITTEKMRINKKLGYALMGFISWAVLWTLMAFAIYASKSYLAEGLVAAFFAMLTGIVASVAMPDSAQKANAKSELKNWKAIAVMVGLAIGAGSLIFGYLILTKQLSEGASIIALTPIVVALASRKIYIDRLTAMQTLGIAIAVLGALVLSFS